MRLTDFQALSFDCYGTLIDWEAGLSAVLVPWARAAGLHLDDEALLAAYASHESAAEASHPAEPYRAILARSLRSLGAELGVAVSEADAERLARSVPDWPAFDDSAGALAVLGTRFKLIILSNVDRDSFAASARLLRAHFDSVLTAEDIGSYKPSAGNFMALLAEAERLGVAAGGLLHVAQSLFHDHVPARQAGLPTVWINRRHDRPGWGATPAPPAAVTPDWEFPSMAAFAAAVTAEDGSPPGGTASAGTAPGGTAPGGPAAAGRANTRQPAPPQQSAEDTDLGWGERPLSGNDERLRHERPPHWDEI